MPDPTQAEREAAVTRAAKRVVMSTWPRDNEGHEAADAIDELEETARAAGRAKGDERIAVLERDLETAQHNQDVFARPFDAGGQMDQVQERNDDLEGALRDAIGELEVYAVDAGRYVGGSLARLRALLPSEGGG